jgi:beta-glucanase (GH16 family)
MGTGRGLLPTFWLLGSDIDVVDWPRCGEIDLMELPNVATYYYYTTLHGPWVQRPAGTQVNYIVGTEGPIGDLSTDFHTYWVTRPPGRVVIGVDGTTLGTYTPESLTSNQQWAFDEPM